MVLERAVGTQPPVAPIACLHSVILFSTDLKLLAAVALAAGGFSRNIDIKVQECDATDVS